MTPTDLSPLRAPYWLAALRRAEDALANHAKWCGYKKDAPGDPSFWNAERALRNAIRRAESELCVPLPAPPAPAVGTEPVSADTFDAQREAFEQAYAARAGRTVNELRALGRVVMPCFCGDATCEGWQSVSARSLAFDLWSQRQP